MASRIILHILIPPPSRQFPRKSRCQNPPHIRKIIQSQNNRNLPPTEHQNDYIILSVALIVVGLAVIVAITIMDTVLSLGQITTISVKAASVLTLKADLFIDNFRFDTIKKNNFNSVNPPKQPRGFVRLWRQAKLD